MDVYAAVPSDLLKVETANLFQVVLQSICRCEVLFSFARQPSLFYWFVLCASLALTVPFAFSSTGLEGLSSKL